MNVNGAQSPGCRFLELVLLAPNPSLEFHHTTMGSTRYQSCGVWHVRYEYVRPRNYFDCGTPGCSGSKIVDWGVGISRAVFGWERAFCASPLDRCILPRMRCDLQSWSRLPFHRTRLIIARDAAASAAPSCSSALYGKARLIRRSAQK